MKDVLKALNQRPVAYYPINAKMMNSITGGVALSQIMYWFTAGKNPPKKIYKTDAELQEETHLTANEMRTAKKKLKTLDFLTVSREGVPAKTFYEIDWDAYYSSLVKFTKQDCDTNSNDESVVETDTTDELKEANKISEIHETITESTHRLPENKSQAPIVTDKSDDDLPKAFTETMLEAIDVATYLSSKLSESMDNFKAPSVAGLHKWAKDIDLAIRKDGRTKSQLLDAITWIHDGSGTFWIGNVRSGKKLRVQFDIIWFQMNESKPKIPIRTRALDAFDIGKVFFEVMDKSENRALHICLFGDYGALYDYRGNKYIDKVKAEKIWPLIEKDFENIVARFKAKQEEKQKVAI